MRFAFTDEQQLLQESLRGVIARDLPLHRVREDLTRADRAPVRALGCAQGWPGIGIDEEHAGQGGGAVEQALLAVELGYGAVPSSAILGGALAGLLLHEAGDVDHLAALAEGERTIVAGIGAGAAGLDGVLGAPEAELLVVVDDAGTHLIATDATIVIARELVDPGRTIGDVVLDGAARTTVGPPADVARARALGAVLVSAEAIGAAERLLAMTTDYVTQRQQFGVVIGSFQAVKHAAADMVVDLETARSAVFYAAWALDAGDASAHRAASIAKSVAVPAAVRVADTALALHGAVGFTWEHDLHLLLKRTHTAQALFGSAGAHREQIAASLDLALSA